MDPVKSSDLAFPSPSSYSSTPGKTCSAPTFSQDSAAPQKQFWTSDMTSDAQPQNTLPLVSPEHDGYTDGDHKSLDASILEKFNLHLDHDKEPDLALLLLLITGKDKRLITHMVDEAEELLRCKPLVTEVLRESWKARSFKKV
jgi:hypothetical protein